MYEYLKMLERIWRSPQTFQSDYSRAKSKLIAEAASRGHITSVSRGCPIGLWHITKKGMELLENHGGFRNEEKDNQESS